MPASLHPRQPYVGQQLCKTMRAALLLLFAVLPNGNEHILMMVDQFTKWVEIVPLPSQTAEVTAKAAVNSFFSRFGYPLHMHSDQGRNFESKLFAELCKALEIHKTRTTPYRPSSNGQVERFNRTLMNVVRCFIDGQQDRWEVYLPQIAGAMRSAVNRSTGKSANMMMLGRETNIPATLMFPLKNKISDEDPESYVAKLVREIESPDDMLVFHFNPWVVDIEGKVDNNPDYNTVYDVVRFTCNGTTYIGRHFRFYDENGKEHRHIVGSFNAQAGQGTFTATYVGKYAAN